MSIRTVAKRLIGYYDPESAEILIALTSILWGAWVLIFGDHIFDPATTLAYVVMAKWAPPIFWGVTAIAQGAFQFITCKGANIRLRRLSSIFGVIFWAAVLGSIGSSDWRLPVITFVSTFTVTNAWVYLRLGMAGRANGE
jgi:hypothetical protein